MLPRQENTYTSMATAGKESDDVVALSLFMLLLLWWFKIFKRYGIAGLILVFLCLFRREFLFVYPPHLPYMIFYDLFWLRDFARFYFAYNV